MTVDSKLTISGEKEYYRILECQMNADYVGLYILAKEVRDSQVTTVAAEIST